MFKTILVCLDGSKLAEQILPFALAQGTQFKSKIVLINVIPENDIIWERGGNSYAELFQQAEIQSMGYLEKIARKFKQKGLKTNCVVLRDVQVSDAIINYVQSNNVDLVTITTHGRGGLGRLFMGSIAEHILKRTGLPVLIVRAK